MPSIGEYYSLRIRNGNFILICTVCMYVCNSLCFVATAKLRIMTALMCDMTTPTSSSHKAKLIGGTVTMCLFVAMIACVLSRCGDVEINPGPGCEH